jgi:hypothetical protein
MDQTGNSMREGSRETAAAAARLRVALILDTFTQPAWVGKLVADIQSSTFARVGLVVKEARPRTSWVAKLWRGKHHLLPDAFVGIDARIFRGSPDALLPADLGDLLRDCPLADASDTARIQAFAPDVAIAVCPPSGACAGIARYGTWSVPVAGDEHAIPGLWEVLEGAGATDATIATRVNGSPPRVISRSWGPTDHVSIRRNRSRAFWKGAALLLRKLRDVAAEGPAALPAAPEAPPLREKPGNLAMAGLALRHTLRYVRGKLLHYASREQWSFAYAFENPSAPRDDYASFIEVTPPRDRYWADPFPVQGEDGRRFIFVEEFRYREGKGMIVAMEVDPAKGVGEPVPVLERPYHLSYPYVFRWQGRLYMVPESSANRTLTLFRCVSFPDRWVEEKELLRDVDAVDATLEEIDGRWWMFVNVGAFGAGNRDELHLFHAETPLGPWTPHRRNPVKSDCRCARPGGTLFRRDGQLFRPAQNCAGAYGSAIVIHRVDLLSLDDYRETAVATVVPTWHRSARRAHTLGHRDGIVTIDLLRRRRRFP